MDGAVKVRVVSVIEIFILLDVIHTEKGCLLDASLLLGPLLEATVDYLHVFMAVDAENPEAATRPLTHVLVIEEHSGGPLHSKGLHGIFKVPFPRQHVMVVMQVYKVAQIEKSGTRM